MKKKESPAPRLDVLKTYKIYINGQFPRTESGRYYPLVNAKGVTIANVCLSSRKDVRDAVLAARNAASGWANRTAYNRAQILYRIGEMLESRREEFIAELVKQGLSASQGKKEVELSIDRLIYFAGWADKFQQIFSSVNPVSSSHFNFSILEPMGVVSVIAPEEPSLLGIISLVAPVIAGGNTCVVLPSYSRPLSSITFSEVLNTSDLPAGVINIITGTRAELLTHLTSHMEVNGVIYIGKSRDERVLIETNCALSVKRLILPECSDWTSKEALDPYLIAQTQEVKTTWHPIGQ